MIRVFVGCAPDGADAESQAVLEYTLRSRCSLPVDITWMIASRDSLSMWSGWDMRRWATPFSGFRWAVPAVCGFQGRAIYMDSDVIVLGDLAELWQMPLEPGQAVAARSASKFCVSLWDCAAAQRHLLTYSKLLRADGHDRQSAYFRKHPGLVRAFGLEWNYLDDADAGPFAKIVHYTDLRTQPHMPYARRRLAGLGLKHWHDGSWRPGRDDVARLFEEEFVKAAAAGYTPERYQPAERFGPIGKRSLANYKRKTAA